MFTCVTYSSKSEIDELQEYLANIREKVLASFASGSKSEDTSVRIFGLWK